MDDSLYDEFGNFIGHISESDDEPSPAADTARETAYLDDDDDNEAVPKEEQLMEVDEEVPTNAIILHEDKQYYPSAESVFGPGVEILVQEEDTQPLSEPIIQPIKTKKFMVEERDLPEVSYDRSYLRALMDEPDGVRNIAIVGHLHHGKTGLVDMLVSETHVLPALKEGKADNRLRYTDTHVLERARGISIKSTPITLLLPSLKGKSFVFNFIDTPGHVNFEDEIASAIRLADGILLVVDAVEGVMCNTEQILKYALQENLSIVLLVNKLDRLILELKLPPADAYYKLRHTIEEINTIIASHSANSNAPHYRLSPEKGNVIFASTSQGWSFTLPSFAQLYAETYPQIENLKSLDTEAFASRLWGDIFFNPLTRKFQRKAQGPNGQGIRSFVHFILEPLYKMYAQTIGEDGPTLKTVLDDGLDMTLKDKMYKRDARELVSVVTKTFFGGMGGLGEALLRAIPSPLKGGGKKIPQSYTGPADSGMGKAIEECASDGPLVVHVTKLYNTTDASSFSAFGRVFSGTLRRGQKVKILGEGYTLEDEEDQVDGVVVESLAIPGGRYIVPVDEVPAGSLCLIGGIDNPIIKTATIVDSAWDEEAYIFRPIQHFTSAVFKLAIEPTNPSDLPRMLEGLRKVNKSYPLLQTRVEESGEHVLMGTGEIYLDCVMHDLRVLYAEVDIKVSDPGVRFAETVVETSALKCYAETPNKRNKITMIAEPLDQGIAEDIENGNVTLNWPLRQVSGHFQKNYGWDLLASRSIWAFGPDERGPNILMDDTLPGEVDKKLLSSVRESLKQGFSWGSREGPLCDEPIRNVKFRLLNADLATEPIYRGGGQIIPTARRVCYSSFLTATPRLMEPVYNVEIQAPHDCVNIVYGILAKRRGHVIKDEAKAGSPLYTIRGILPVIDSVGFESDLRLGTQGQGFCQCLFDHWQVVPGDPLDASQTLRPLEPAQAQQLARDFCVKTRRRKGLNVEVSAARYMDKEMIEAMTSLELGSGLA